MHRPFVPPVWCTCGADGEHLASFGAMCAPVTSSGATHQPLVSSPRAPGHVSSHRTSRTDRPSFAFATPLGTTSRFAVR